MKLKLWKWVGIAALPLVAVVTLPVVLTSCSSASPETQNADYQPDSATAEKFSESDFEIVRKGIFKMMPNEDTSVTNVSLVGHKFKIEFMNNKDQKGGYMEYSLVPTGEGENIGKYSLIMTGTPEYPLLQEWLDLQNITQFFQQLYDAGLVA